MEEIISIEVLARKACDSFENVFGQEPDVGAFAPGRVNLIGEHTDYNDGFVFPMALPLATIIVGKKSDSGICKIVTLCPDVDDPKEIEIPLSSLAELAPGKPKWANYVKGVLNIYPRRDDLAAFNAIILSSVPCGSGLASSAALEVATFTFLDSLIGVERLTNEDKMLKAILCQQVEHKFAGVPCGIMDQLVSSAAEKDHAIFIDCRNILIRPQLFCDPNLAILIVNSNVKHELSTGEYAIRKSQCEQAATVMGLTMLRDAMITVLEKSKEKMSETCYKRAKHVILENQRCRDSRVAISENDYQTFGKLMTSSHNSLRDDFEVSCNELDHLVNLATEIEGVYGSRMTGGGFGGCTVTLLERSSVNNVVSHIKAKFIGEPKFYLCTPSAGAGKIDLNKLSSYSG